MEPLTIVRLVVGILALSIPLLNPVFAWKFNRGHYRRRGVSDDSMSWEMAGALIWMLAYVQGLELLISACFIGLGMSAESAHGLAFVPSVLVAWAAAKPIGAYVSREHARYEKQVALEERFKRGEITEAEYRRLFYELE